MKDSLKLDFEELENRIEKDKAKWPPIGRHLSGHQGQAREG